MSSMPFGSTWTWTMNFNFLGQILLPTSAPMNLCMPTDICSFSLMSGSRPAAGPGGPWMKLRVGGERGEGRGDEL